jgi:hypothetical protein
VSAADGRAARGGAGAPGRAVAARREGVGALGVILRTIGDDAKDTDHKDAKDAKDGAEDEKATDDSKDDEVGDDETADDEVGGDEEAIDDEEP